MVDDKVEGAEKDCGQCGTHLTCRMSTVKPNSNFPPKLQWQNPDGTPHFKTKDGKNYTCNIPDGSSKPNRNPKIHFDVKPLSVDEVEKLVHECWVKSVGLANNIANTIYGNDKEKYEKLRLELARTFLVAMTNVIK